MVGPGTPANTWKTAFRGALKLAFDQASIDLLIADFFPPDTFDNLSPPGFGKTFEYRLFEVIREAEMADWLVDLVAAAHERRPKNAEIGRIADNLGLSAAGPRLANQSGQSLEALVQANAKFINPTLLHEKLAELEGQICWVSTAEDRGGTGFLVASDLVITNQHVIKPVSDGAVRWQDVTCRFDFKLAIDGTPMARLRETTVALAGPDWLVDSRPPSKSDWKPALGDAGPEETDCAVIRLAEPIGDLPVGGDTVDTKAEPRGWIAVNSAPPAVVAGNQVLLLQHPKGEPLQLSIGAVKAFNASGTRMRHDANSRDGSSGSPLFDVDLRLVALHHAHDLANPPEWNQAVPFGTILDVWAKYNVSIS
jgi:hypothetical protein